jgi:hypothetical protein
MYPQVPPGAPGAVAPPRGAVDWGSARLEAAVLQLVLVQLDHASRAAACATVRARPGRLSAFRVSHSKLICMAILCGRAGRLTTQHGGFRLGQCRHWCALHRERFPAQATARWGMLGRLGGKVNSTGLTQHSQVDPAVLLQIPIRALELAQILGQPCGFQVGGVRATLDGRPAGWRLRVQLAVTGVGLGRIVASHYRSSTLYQIC